MSDRTSETTLLCRARDGDRDALARLLLLHYDELRQYITSRVTAEVQDIWHADDIQQQTFVRAAQAIHRFEPQPQKSFSGWLKIIAANLIRDARKRRMRERRAAHPQRTAGGSAPAPFDDLTAGLTSPSACVHRDDSARRLKASLERLPPNQREVLQRYYFQEQSLDDIAAALRCSRDTVRGICYRARNNLRELLGSSSGYFSS